MRACAPQGASCCIFYLGNAFFETFPKIVFFQNLGGGFLPSQRAVPLRTRESNQGRQGKVKAETDLMRILVLASYINEYLRPVSFMAMCARARANGEEARRDCGLFLTYKYK